ncbi:MAG TPA: hypothetical protein VHE30_03465 [Polyangiaceae bacterium]|nr:hypothetical protein [Polyangiaceae bacterium]
MKRCEVCDNFRPGAEVDTSRGFIEMVFGSRAVLLCRGHARIAANAGVTTFEELREYYGSGRRSHVPRRARTGSAGVAGAPRSPGRRATDRTL